FEDVGSHGTKVFIYNLWMNDDGLLELDFDDDDEDILLRDETGTGGFSRFHREIVQHHISHKLRSSLRAYASILYLRKFKNFEIILRGKPVEQVHITEEMKFKKVVTYKPQVGVGLEAVSVRTTIGFAKEAPVLGIFGINVYHKNRLIMPFWKVLQDGSSRGRSVVGVLEANFIEPAHDKQDFERTPLFIRLETKLRQIIIDYWNNHCHLIGYQPIKRKADMASKQKGSDKSSNGQVQNMQQKMNRSHKTLHEEPVIELANKPQKKLHKEPVVGLAANIQDQPSQHVIGLGTTDGSAALPITLCEEEDSPMEPSASGEIEELQHELEEMKGKCAQVASQLELRKKNQRVT
ncbi:MORC family CW-type zinc finger protein 4, partial [Ananas comosus]